MMRERSDCYAPYLPTFASGNKFINRNVGLFDSTPESTEGKFFVPGYDTPFIAPAQYDVAPSLAYRIKSELLENLDGFIA